MKEQNPWALVATFLAILACRLMPHPDGFTPLIAVSCIATYLIGWRATMVVLAGNFIADAWLGFYDAWSMVGTYTGLLAAGLSMALTRGRLSFAAGIVGSVLFFGLSNLGVWLGGYYGMTPGDLIHCYAAAIPFWKTQCLADVLLVGGVLGVAWAREVRTHGHRPSGRLAGSRAGFTLIELLVVISIIAVLAAILFPVLARAKAAAKKTQAIAYVRQLGLASTMYTSDNDECFVRDLITGSDRTYYWWGSFDGTILKPEEGPLYPYTKSKGVQVDPVFPDSLRTAVGLTGFGYNYAYLSPTDYDANWNPTYRSVSDTQVGSPSETLAFASAARINNWSYGSSWALEGNPFIDPPSFQFPGVHARHAGDRAVAVWVDGHASAPAVGTRPGSFGYGLQSQWFASSHLGDVMFSGCPHGSECEDYYYDLR